MSQFFTWKLQTTSKFSKISLILFVENLHFKFLIGIEVFTCFFGIEVFTEYEKWAINLVHHELNRWHEMKVRSIGQRQIHSQMVQIWHDHPADFQLVHIHATILIHGIWKTMPIFRGKFNWYSFLRFTCCLMLILW